MNKDSSEILRYREFVEGLIALRRKAERIPLPAADLPEARLESGRAGTVLLFSPHPDDECIVGILPLRLLREGGYGVVNVAVTLGSRQDRQQARWHELRNACRFLGFGLEKVAENGLERINAKTRDEDPSHWQAAVAAIAAVVASHRPAGIFLPHRDDRNSTHIGTHFLVMDALALLGDGIDCFLVETEFWGAMADPNLMIACSARDLAALIEATSYHVGEVERNPYHICLPAWMQDNVRRGAEIVGGQGGDAPDFDFATLYRISAWRNGRVVPHLPKTRIIATEAAVCNLFEE